jgi:isopenicillin N synthase-like dioxygenase
MLAARRIGQAAPPIVDLAGLGSSRRSQREAVGHQLRAACLDKGFFYIANHGVPAALIEALLDESRRFFALPPNVKREVARSKSACYRGYDGYREQILEPDTPPDLKEGFYVGLELPEDDPRVRAGKFNHGPNLWPRDLPQFRPTVAAYLAAMQEVGARLLQGIALSLSLPEDHFVPFCTEPMVTLRLLHYPPQPADAAPGEKGAGAHTDWDALTILLQDDVGGLQIYDRRVGWVPAEPIPGTFIVNIGDMLARWTNDLYRSTVHRVINVSNRERYSVPFFLGGNPDAVVEALPGCTGPENPPLYPPTTAENHLREMYERSYRSDPADARQVNPNAKLSSGR